MFVTSRLRVLVQGITGREASFWTERMIAYGTDIVAGVTPGKGGQFVHSVPVYDSVAAACQRHVIDVSVLFVPAGAVKAAARDAIRQGVGRLIALAEHVPIHDVMELLAEAADRCVQVIGPNCPGVVIPGKYFIGILPAWMSEIFQPGPIGVVSRSGSLGTLICLNLVRAGLGQSAFVGIGGDQVVGTTFLDVLRMFEADPRTRVVVMVGEIGGTMEESAAAYILEMTKPVVALVAGRCAPEETRMGHAGAFVSGRGGSARAKLEAFRRAGAQVAEVPSQVTGIVSSLLNEWTG